MYSRFTECLNFVYSVRFFRESVAGGGWQSESVSTDFATRASWWQELQVAVKSVEIVHSTTHHALTEKT